MTEFLEVFFHNWNEWKNPQLNFLSQNISLEGNFFKWDGKVTKISHPLFHRIWKNIFFAFDLGLVNRYVYKYLEPIFYLIKSK